MDDGLRVIREKKISKKEGGFLGVFCANRPDLDKMTGRFYGTGFFVRSGFGA